MSRISMINGNCRLDSQSVESADADSAQMTELGRFSVEYQRLFGQPPSVTLNKSAY